MFSWFKRLRDRKRARRLGRKPRQFQPLLEQLEARDLPSRTGLREMLAQPRTQPAADYDLSIQLAPNDPRYTNGSLYGLNKIQAPAAWDTTTGSLSVVVAVIDTGVDYTHPDLYLNIWINQDEIPFTIGPGGLTDTDGNGLITFWDLNQSVNAAFVDDWNGNGRIDAGDLLDNRSDWENGIDNGGNGYLDDLVGWDFVNNDNNPMDDYAHGTHVAGTIGAIGNNSVGVVGVNWNVQIMALKFLDATGYGSSADASEAIRYSVDMGAPISNNSWAGYLGADDLSSAIAYSLSHGQLFVACAGNDGLNNDTAYYRSYPASYSYNNIISVTATNNKDSRPPWANWGKTSVDLGAPGVGIVSTVPFWYSSTGYASFSGTSMATPHVAGAAALLLAYNPDLTYDQLKSLLLNNVDKVKALSNKTVTGGRLNIAKAMDAASALYPYP